MDDIPTAPNVLCGSLREIDQGERRECLTLGYGNDPLRGSAVVPPPGGLASEPGQ